MSEEAPFTIEQFYKYVEQGKLMGGRCKKCGTIYLPPRPLCTKCFSKDFEWVEISPKGKLLTYTIIHVAPVQFQSMAPYAVGIVQLENGLKIPGMIRDVEHEKIEIGMELQVGFEKPSATASQWPQWPRYYFKPV
ncbi:Zn-ribbon domain-containing OB-fold protein [Candidatus Bathyarchaeota archaeon]|nr:MAG: Zn-ribbon domain-containing OB-fold protein [Candidatus Bathyarchaeota archaeon]